MLATAYALLFLTVAVLIIMGMLRKQKKLPAHGPAPKPQEMDHVMQPRLNRDPALSLGRRSEDEAGGES